MCVLSTLHGHGMGMRRQAPLAFPPPRLHPNHLRPPPLALARPPARLALPPRDARPPLERRHVLASRDRPRRHDAAGTERTRRVLLRDVQVLGTRHARLDRRERERSVLPFPFLFFFSLVVSGGLRVSYRPDAMADRSVLPPSLCGMAATPLPLLPTTTPLAVPTTTTTAAPSSSAGGKPSSAAAAATASSSSLLPPPNLSPLSLLYDVSRPEDVTVVITEAGLIPVQSVPVLLRDYKPVQGRNS